MQIMERHLKVFCPTHKISFAAIGASVIICEGGPHALARNFPLDDFWEYCCDCQNFWPSDLVKNQKGQEQCPVCDRVSLRRYLCDQCKVMSLDSGEMVKRKGYSIQAGSIVPACPGCLKAERGELSEHHCPEVNVGFTTMRGKCPFCEETLRHETKRRRAAYVPPPKAQPVPAPSNGRKATATVAGQSSPTPPLPVNGSNLRPPEKQFTSDFAAASATLIKAPSVVQKIFTRQNVALAVLAFFGIVLLIGWLNRPRPENKQSPVPPGMVYVPGAYFTMGTDKGDDYERPQHGAAVGAFFIDLYEVTCEQYGKFIAATGHTAPQGWTNGRYPEGASRLPVTGVNWDDATSYAQWAGKRLPTEEEWELAARGTDGRRYPWGNDWKSNAANADTNSPGHLLNVGSFPDGKSPFGVYDMVGNAWEWTASSLKSYPGGRLPVAEATDDKVIRGGFFGSRAAKATTTFRRGWPARGGEDYKNTGFRCVMSAPGAPGSP